jgi:isopenicillin-N N-acyltransferase-like protein
MSLRAADDGVGVPRVFVSRHALEASSRADAVSRTGIPGRSGGYAYSFALAGGGAFTIETSASRQVVLDGAGVHTNHYVAPELTAADADPSEGSRGRYERLAALVAQRPPSTPQDLMSVLADHDATPTAICTHADPADGDDAEAVLFSMVCDLEAGRMWVAAGNPCEAPYEEVELAGVI